MAIPERGKVPSWQVLKLDDTLWGRLARSRTRVKAGLGELLFLGDLLRSLPIDADCITLSSLTTLAFGNSLSLYI